MKKSKFIIHLGGQKSGSSAIQGYLFFNRYALYEKGLVYIDKNFSGEQDKCISHNHMLEMIRDETKEALDKKFKLLSTSYKNKNFIFSSEGLCTIAFLKEYADKLSSLTNYFDVQLILYVRNQVEVHYSGWQQWGVPINLDFDTWVSKAVEEDRANWYKIATIWKKYFRKSDFIVKVFNPNNLLNKDIVEDFIMLTGIPSVKSKVPSRANYTFSDLAIQVILNVARINNIDLRDLFQRLKKEPPEFLKLEKENLVLSEKMNTYIKNYYYIKNELLFQTFNIDKEAQTLFNIPLIEPLVDKSCYDLPSLSDEFEKYLEKKYPLLINNIKENNC